MKVINVSEECHGLVCVAQSMKAAYQFLVKHRYLTFNTDIEIADNWMTVGEFFDERGWEKTDDNLIMWAWTRTEPEFWDGMFYFDAADVYEED